MLTVILFIVHCIQFPRKRQFWRGGGATNAAAIVDTMHELSFFIKYLERSPRYRQLDVNYTMHIDDDVKFLTLLILAEKERMKVSKEKKRIASESAEAERVAIRAAEFEKRRLQLEQESVADMVTHCVVPSEQGGLVISPSDIIVETTGTDTNTITNTNTNTDTDRNRNANMDPDLAPNLCQRVDQTDPGSSSSSSSSSSQSNSSLSRYFGSFVSLVGDRLGVLLKGLNDVKQLPPPLASTGNSSSSGGGSGGGGGSGEDSGSSCVCVDGRREGTSSDSDSGSTIKGSLTDINTSSSSGSGRNSSSSSSSNSNSNSKQNNNINGNNNNNNNSNSSNSNSNNNSSNKDATRRSDIGRIDIDCLPSSPLSPSITHTSRDAEAQVRQHVQHVQHVQQHVQQRGRGEEDETLPPFSVSRAGLYNTSIPYNTEENFMPIWIDELPCTLKGTYNILRPKSLIEKERELSEMRLRALARQKAAFGIAACYHPFLASLINGTESAWDSEVDADDDAGSGDY